MSALRDAPIVPETYTLREALQALACDRKTLAVWLRKAQIVPLPDVAYHPDSSDDRAKRVLVAEVERLAALHGRTLCQPGVRGRVPMRHAPPRRGSAHQEPQIVPLPSRAPPTAGGTDTDSQPLLPAGWIAFTTFCDEHGVSRRTCERLVGKGHLPQVHVAPGGPKDKRQWWVRIDEHGHRYEIRRAYSREDHALGCAVLARQFPTQYHPCDLDCPDVETG